MAEPIPTLAEAQRLFTAYIRDPRANPPPAGIPPRRMAVYRELLFNNIQSFLANYFPVLHSLHDESSWTALLYDFYARHRCQTPHFIEIAGEFLDYLQTTRGPRPEDPPFLLELAHYEWVELALLYAQCEPPASLASDAVLDTPLLPSELAWPLAYRWPVHRIGPEHRPDQPPEQPTFLLVYRDADDRVRFMEINAVTFRLLSALRERPGCTGRALLEALARELAYPDPARLLAKGAELLADFATRRVLGGAG